MNYHTVTDAADLFTSLEKLHLDAEAAIDFIVVPNNVLQQAVNSREAPNPLAKLWSQEYMDEVAPCDMSKGAGFYVAMMYRTLKDAEANYFCVNYDQNIIFAKTVFNMPEANALWFDLMSLLGERYAER